jgi:hypothetical protein
VSNDLFLNNDPLPHAPGSPAWATTRSAAWRIMNAGGLFLRHEAVAYSIGDH